MTISKEERLKRVHERALREFDLDYTAVYEERKQCLADRRMYSIAGAQWEGPLSEQFANKPKFELNKIHLAVMRIISEYRNNRITVDFTSKTGEDGDDLADVCDGLYRADEQDSGAQEAYDNAYEEAVGGGFGAYRLRACYENESDDDDSRQRIRLEPIFDADSSVFFDRGAKRQDKSDAQHCTVIYAMTPEAYKDEYDEDTNSWPKPQLNWFFDWWTPRVVYVAEYYEIEMVSELVHFYRGISLDDSEPNELRVTDEELKANPEKDAELRARGFQEVRQKRIKRQRVHKYIVNGNRVLEDCGLLAGEYIPIVPVYGKRWYVDGIERCMGHVRLAKDAQRLKNMIVSWLAEISTMSPVEKPIFAPEQIAGHQQMWADDPVKRYPYVLVNPMEGPDGSTLPPQPIGYTKAPSVPPALAALLQITEQDLQDLLGNQQAGEELQPNMSGKAVELVQNRLDMQVFIYMSNMAKAVKRGGEIWLSMARELYTEDERKMKTLASDGQTAGSVVLQQPSIGEEGEQITKNDLTDATFDVAVDVGPSSNSRRAALVRAVTGLLQLNTDPETQQVLTSLAIMNLEGEGLGDVHAYFRNKLVRAGVVQPSEEEKAQLQQEAANQQPDPNAQYLMAAAQKQQADAQKAIADTQLSHANADKAQADALKTLASIDTANKQQVLDAISLLHGILASGAQTAQTAPAQQQ